MDAENENEKFVNQEAEEYGMIIQCVLMIIIAIIFFSFCYYSCCVTDLRDNINGQENSEWTIEASQSRQKVRRKTHETI